MSQHDYVLDNQAGAAFRADLNNALAAIVSQNSGASAPATTYAYMLWADTTTGLLKIRNAANSAWITIGQLADIGIQTGAQITASAGGTADAITASFTPAIAALTNGMTLFVRAASANTKTTPTFTPASGTITAKSIVKLAGAALVVGDIAGAGHWLELQYDSTLDKWVLQNPAKAAACSGNAATASALQTARTINGVSFDGTANISIPTTPTTSDVLTATAGAAVGAVGSYAFLRLYDANDSAAAGATRAGSALRYSGVGNSGGTSGAAYNSSDGGTPSGTWRCMGYSGNPQTSAVTLWLRIS